MTAYRIELRSLIGPVFPERGEDVRDIGLNPLAAVKCPDCDLGPSVGATRMAFFPLLFVSSRKGQWGELQ